MSETMYTLIGLLAIILVVSLYALMRNKNIRQRLKFPWLADWMIETSDAVPMSQSRVRSNVSSGIEEQNQGVDFGTQNQLTGSIEAIAGQDIGHSQNPTAASKSTKSSSVNFGENNIFSGEIGEIAGRNIYKGSDHAEEKTTSLNNSSIDQDMKKNESQPKS